MSNQSGTPTPDATTLALLANAEKARARVAADIRELARELTPAELKERALDAAERSVEDIAARALRRLTALPHWLAVSVRRHPVVAGVVAVGTGTLIWRIAHRRR